MYNKHFLFLLELSIPSKPGSHERKATNQHVNLFCIYHQILPLSMPKIVEKTPPYDFLLFVKSMDALCVV